MSEAENTPSKRRASGFSRSIEVEGDKEEDTSWLMVYLDVITLLLIVFVILLVLMEPTPDAQPGGQGVLEGSEHIFEGQPSVIEGAPGSNQIEIPPELRERGIEAVGEEETLTFRLDDSVLFNTAEAELLPEGREAINELVPIFQSTGARISIEGHTDNVPIATDQFPSNWELSATRASSVLRHLAAQGIEEKRMRAIGYGDIRPIASNDTAEGRAKNRRVEIILHVDPDRQDFDDLPINSKDRANN